MKIIGLFFVGAMLVFSLNSIIVPKIWWNNFNVVPEKASTENQPLIPTNDQSTTKSKEQSTTTAHNLNKASKSSQTVRNVDGTHFLRALEKNAPIQQKNKNSNIKPAQIWHINDTKTFVASNFTDKSNYYVNATLRAASERALIWVDDNDWQTKVTQEDADYLAQKFTEYYPVITNFFGEPYDVDGDGIINVSILLTELDGWAAGYFWSTGQNLNGMTMFYLDNDAGIEGTYDDTLVHEYQHVIHNNKDSDETAWIDEGAADFAVFISGQLEAKNNLTWKIPYFEDTPGTSLTYWDYNSDSHDVRIDYAKSFLFMLYLSERYGGSQIISSLVSEPANGVQGVQNVLPSGVSFQDVFNDWALAVYLDNPSIADGRFGYTSLDLNTSYRGIISGNVSSTVAIEDYGFAAFLLNASNGGTWNITIDGDSTTSFNVTLATFDVDTPTIQFLTLDAQNNGSIQIPAYGKTLFLITRDEGSNGDYGISPTKSMAFSVELLENTELTVYGPSAFPVSNGYLNISQIALKNGTTLVTAANISGVSIIDSEGHFTELTQALIYDNSPNVQNWTASALIPLESLPAGTYYALVYFALNNVAVQTTFVLPSITENTTYWTTLVTAVENFGVSGEYDILNISTHLTEEYVFINLGLREKPQFGDGIHYYKIYFDSTTDSDSFSDFVITQFPTFANHSFIYNYDTSDYFPINTIILGNSVIFKVSLSFFGKYPSTNVWSYSYSGSTEKDSTLPANFLVFSTPTFLSTPDSMIKFVEGETTSISLSWTVADNNPSYYLLYLNNSKIINATWNSNDEITYIFTNTTVGSYNITLVFYDDDGNSAAFEVLITILKDTIAPELTGSSGSLTITQGDTTQKLQWQISDLNPAYYTLYQNETLLVNQTWDSSPATVEYSLSSLDAGTYVFNFTAFDKNGNFNSTTITVIVEASPPSSSSTSPTTTLPSSGATTTPNTTENATSSQEQTSGSNPPAQSTTTPEVPTPGFTAFLIFLGFLSILSIRLISKKKRK